MLRSQIFFSLTELIPSYLYYEYLNRFDLNNQESYKPITLSAVYLVLSSSLLHVYIGLFERLSWGFFTDKFNDANRNKLRDFCLVLNDVCGILFSFNCITKLKHNRVPDKGHIFYIKYCFLLQLILYAFYRIFCSFE